MTVAVCFAQDLLRDVASATVDRVMHLGGDEVRYDCWNQSAALKAWMVEQGWGAQGFDRAYQYAVIRSHQIARSLGRTPTGWGEIWDHMGAALPRDTILHFWLGGGRCADLKNATSQGYRAVWSIDRGKNIGSWYLDSLITTWDTIYLQEPCLGLTEGECSLVLGGGGEQWVETVDASDIEETLWPRLAAIAERLWSSRLSTHHAISLGDHPPPHSGRANATATGMGTWDNPALAAAAPRLQDFRCLLLARGVAAAPVTNAEARAPPKGPGSCWAQ